MASPAQRELCCSLIKQYFGGIVGSVARTLFNFDQANVGQIIHASRVHPSMVKKSLIILIKHQLLECKKQNKYTDHHEYSISEKRIFAFFRHSKYIALAKCKYGEEASVIVKNLIANGYIKLSNLVHSTWEHMLRDKEFSAEEAKKLLTRIHSTALTLITNKYIKRTGPEVEIDLTLFMDQLLKLKGFDMVSQLLQMNEDIKPQIKKIKLEENGDLMRNPDNGIFWQLDLDRFDRDIRDEFVIGAVIKHYGDDQRIGKICQVLLDLSKDSTENQAPITSPIAFEDLFCALGPLFKEKHELEVYLRILDNDTNNRFIFNHGFRIGKGNMYSINVGQILDRLVRELLGTIVSCRFGPKCCRIFRLLMTKKYLLSKQIEDAVMLPTRDVREYTYMLIKEGLVRNLQIPRTADYAPSKSLFIMGVEIDQVALAIIDRCCKSMNNTILRHDHETQENVQLLDRAKAVQNLIKSNETEENVDIWDEYFSVHERQQLDLIKKRLHTLEVSRLQIDDTLHQLLLWMDVRPNMD